MSKTTELKSNGNSIKDNIEAQTKVKATGVKAAIVKEKQEIVPGVTNTRYTKEEIFILVERLNDADEYSKVLPVLAEELQRSEGSIYQKYLAERRSHSNKVKDSTSDQLLEKSSTNKKETWLAVATLLYKWDIQFTARKDAITLKESTIAFDTVNDKNANVYRKSLIIKLVNIGAEFSNSNNIVSIYETPLDLMDIALNHAI